MTFQRNRLYNKATFFAIKTDIRYYSIIQWIYFRSCRNLLLRKVTSSIKLRVKRSLKRLESFDVTVAKPTCVQDLCSRCTAIALLKRPKMVEFLLKESVIDQIYTQKNPSSNSNHYDSPQGSQYNATMVILEV